MKTKSSDHTELMNEMIDLCIRRQRFTAAGFSARIRCVVLLTLVIGLGLVGCKREDSTSSTNGLTKVRLALNWKPEPQFGGFYEAQIGGHYAEQGLEVQIMPGGAGTPTVQMIGAGSAEFGIVSADEIVIARDRGNDVVALFAVFQDCPQGLMTHAERNFTAIGDIFNAPGTVAMQKSLPYARLLAQQYDFSKVQVVPSPGGDITAFLADPDFTQQCFVTSEPLNAARRQVKTKTFLVKEAGYNPYTVVLATSRQYLDQHPQVVAAMVEAVRTGWNSYLKNPDSANAAMHNQRPDMDQTTFKESAQAQLPLIMTDYTTKAGVGMMQPSRWQELIDQLKSLGDIRTDVQAAACFYQPQP